MSTPLTATQRIALQIALGDQCWDLTAIADACSVSKREARRIVRSLKWRGLLPWEWKDRSNETGKNTIPQAGGQLPVNTAAPEPQQVGRKMPEARADEQLRVGDVLPLYPDFDWGEWRRQQARRRAIRQAPQHGTRGILKRVLDAREAEDQRRHQCPVEQAKTIIRRTGTPVFAASVIEPKAKGYQVGRRRMSEAELLSHAQQILDQQEARRIPV